MTAQERVEVILAYYNGETVQVDVGTNSWVDWLSTSGEPTWRQWEVYDWRIKPKEELKPYINWEHVSEEFNYLAVDEGGDVFLYSDAPTTVVGCWELTRNGDVYTRCEGFASLVIPEGLDWKKSLISRFDKEENDEG